MKTSKLKPITSDIIYILNEHKLLILREIFNCKDDICGCDLVKRVGISKDLLSYHIKTLRDRRYVEEVRCGRNKKYAISRRKHELVEKILNLLELI